MVNRYKQKGSAKERILRDKLYNRGLLVFRIAGSGSTRKIPATDLIVVYKGKTIGLEVKSAQKLRNFRISDTQIAKLIEISKHLEVWFAVYIKGIGWKFVRFEGCRVINKYDIEKGLNIDQFVSYIKNERILNNI